MTIYNIGDADEWGYILRNRRGPVELWETPNGNFVVYLYATNEHVLYAVRKYREDADALFDSACNMFPNRGQRES